MLILLVEDEPIHRLMIKKILAEGGFRGEVFEAVDGADGLDFVLGRGRYGARSAPQPGLIFLDLKMARMDGFELLAALKARKSTRRIPVVVTTATASDEDVRRCLKLGASACLTKPVTRQELFKTLAARGERNHDADDPDR